ncbi:hypothetical protein GQX73_g7607 [Xylaria multiplex]|uniref:A to I editase domain-containing protein n=1 Tax=Xylaria multiplex TaxID=323545 RepID=A0A7C8MMC5_9PEZI|nr:hypothetical protein GQX73_g7607 [Xylaria multiplex]
MTAKSDLIASLVQQEFDKLPPKRKPVVRDNGLREWVPLSGIVAEEKDGKLTCLSLATGMKCLPSSKLSLAQGNVLHDWHAEVLAIRAFNCFVLDECQAVASGSKDSSAFIRRWSSAEINANPDSTEGLHDSVDWHGQPFTWREDVSLHMYCSEAPCGDASMELTMASQVDATPWESLFLTAWHRPSQTLKRRRASNIIKILLGQAIPPPMHIPAVLTNFTLTSQYSASGCRRAFSDGQGQDEGDKEANSQQARMAPLAMETRSRDRNGGYTFQPFSVKTTDLEFTFSRRSTTTLPPSTSPAIDISKIKITPSNLSVAHTASGREETTLNGVLQGRKASEATIRGASFASRRRTWALAVEVAGLLSADESNTLQIQQALGASPSSTETSQTPAITYRDLKNTPLLEARRRAKQVARNLALKGWVRNLGDEDFALQT